MFNQGGGAVVIGGAAANNAGITLGQFSGSEGIYELNSGTVSAGSIVIGPGGSGQFSQFGGTATFGAGSSIGPAGSEFINSGILNLPGSSGQFAVTTGGQFTQGGGTINGYLTNNATFNYNAGTFNGTYENGFSGQIIWSGSFFAGGGVLNKGNITLITGNSMGSGTLGLNAVDNEATLLLAGGSTLGPGLVLNNGSISGFGTLGGTGGFTNNGVAAFNNGTLLLNNSGVNSNNGTILGTPGNFLQIDSNLSNSGTISLGGGTLRGAGSLTNAPAGSISGFGTLSITTFNNAGGTVYAQGGTFHFSNAITNAGVIEVAAGATINGGAIANVNSILGAGTIANIVTNTGAIEPVAGTLTLSAGLTNSASGIIYVDTATKLLLSAGLATNAGTINLTGGTFDNSVNALNNTGTIVGYGILRTGGGGLTNNGSILFAGGSTTINGAVTNDSPREIEVRNTPAIFTGSVINNAGGLLKTTNTTATFAGSFVNNGTYTSDPSTQIFQSTATNNGTMTGNTGDVFIFLGGTFSNTGVFTNGGTLQSSDPATNTGTFTQSGPQIWSAGTTFTNNGGTATFNSNTGNATAAPLSVFVTAGLVNFGADQHLNSLSIQAGNVSVLAGVTKTNSLAFGGSTSAWVGELDLTSAKLVIEDSANHVSTLALAKNQVAFGRTHNAGVLSSTIPTNKTFVVSDNAVGHLTTFGGTAVDAGSILETVAYKGDFNLDGVVDIQDLTTVANHWQQPVVDWSQGDFDGSNFVDIQDLTAVANNWQAGVVAGGGSGESFADALAQIGGLGKSAATPEPASLAVLSLGGVVLATRRRSRVR